MDLLKEIVSRSYKSRSIKLVIWYFENFNHPLLIYMLISVIAFLLFLLKEKKMSTHKWTTWHVLKWSQNIMVVNTIGDTNNGTGACSQMNSYSYRWNLFNEIDVKKLSNYKQLYQISFSFYFFFHWNVFIYRREMSIDRFLKWWKP